VSTSARHLGGVVAADTATVDADGPARRDGNTVQLDRELLTMSRAASDFAAAQTALAAKFRLVRYAINETR
jgi:flagellar basal body rod protein FlgB